MNAWKKQQVEDVISSYNPDHDLGPDCPVTWREERLAKALLDLDEEVSVLKEQIKALLDAVPSAGKKS